MAKSFTQLYVDDNTAGDNLTGGEIIPFDPPPAAAPTVTKAMTLDQLVTWISGELLSQPGEAQFSSSVSTIDEGDSTNLTIERLNYLAYPSVGGSCRITYSGMAESTEFTVTLDGNLLTSGSIINFDQYDLFKTLVINSIPGSITTNKTLTVTLDAFVFMSPGITLVHNVTVLNQP